MGVSPHTHTSFLYFESKHNIYNVHIETLFIVKTDSFSRLLTWNTAGCLRGRTNGKIIYGLLSVGSLSLRPPVVLRSPLSQVPNRSVIYTLSTEIGYRSTVGY